MNSEKTSGNSYEEFKEQFNNANLFRFRTATDCSIENFKNDKLYFSTPEHFNDPYDTSMYVNVNSIAKSINIDLDINLEDTINKEKENNLIEGFFIDASLHVDGIREKFIDSLREQIAEAQGEIRKFTKEICFSHELFSWQMWAHYASNHQGFCLAYEKSDLEKAQCYNSNETKIEKTLFLKDIVYAEQRYDATKFIAQYLTEGAINQYVLRDIICRKQLDWGYEKECRLFPRLLNLQDNNLLYIKVVPTKVFLGADINTEFKKQIIKIAKKKQIEVYEMKILDYFTDYIIIPVKVK